MDAVFGTQHDGLGPVGAFVAFCHATPQGPGAARDVQDLRRRLGMVLHTLLTGYSCPREALLGALVLLKSGVLDGCPLPEPGLSAGEHWAHHMARHARTPEAGLPVGGPDPGNLPLSARFRVLIDQGFDLSGESGPAPSPLSAAVAADNWESLAAMLEAGARPEPHPAGEPLLFRAIEKGHPDVLTVLLRSGEILALRDRGQRTALHAAVDADNPEALFMMVEQLEKTAGDARLVSWVNAKDIEGRTALYYAAQAGDCDVVERLCEMPGLVFETPDDTGDTVLHLAVRETGADVVECLLECGMPVDIRGRGGCTALHVAMGRADHKVVEVLLREGADLNARNHQGHTPFQFARAWASNTRKHPLRSWPASSKMPTPEALHEAVASGNLAEVCRVLLGGVDANAEDAKGERALLAALRRDEGEIAALLLAAGADVEAASMGGVSVLALAAMQGAIRVFEVLLRAASFSGEEIEDVRLIATKLGRDEFLRLLPAKEAPVGPSLSDKSNQPLWSEQRAHSPATGSAVTVLEAS